MSNTIQYKVMRKSETLDLFGISKSNLHIKIKKGVFPPPISLGDRAVGFLSHELKATLSAMAKGYTEEELRLLIQDLIDNR